MKAILLKAALIGFSAVAIGAVGPELWASLAHPDEIVFRSSVAWDKDGRSVAGTKVDEWRLKIPREFYLQTEGYFQHVLIPGSEKWASRQFWRFRNGGSLLSVLAVVTPAGEVVPHTVDTDIRDGSHESFSFILSNGIDEKIQEFGRQYCITKDDWFKATGPKLCTTPNCTIFMSFDGWPAHVSVPRLSLYRDPQRVCQILRNVLNKWTVSIDPRLVPTSLGK